MSTHEYCLDCLPQIFPKFPTREYCRSSSHKYSLGCSLMNIVKSYIHCLVLHSPVLQHCSVLQTLSSLVSRQLSSLANIFLKNILKLSNEYSLTIKQDSSTLGIQIFPPALSLFLLMASTGCLRKLFHARESCT